MDARPYLLDLRKRVAGRSRVRGRQAHVRQAPLADSAHLKVDSELQGWPAAALGVCEAGVDYVWPGVTLNASVYGEAADDRGTTAERPERNSAPSLRRIDA